MSERTYKDSDGNPVRLGKLCKDEPEWAANQIRHRDKLERELAEALAESARLREMLKGMEEKQARTHSMLRTAAVAHTRSEAEVARLREALFNILNWGPVLPDSDDFEMSATEREFKLDMQKARKLLEETK